MLLASLTKNTLIASLEEVLESMIKHNFGGRQMTPLSCIWVVQSIDWTMDWVL